MTSESQDLEKATRRLLELQDSRDWAAVEACVDPGMVAHVGTEDLDAAGWVAMGTSFYAAFPDARHHLERTVVQGDIVVAIGRFGGTHKGELMGIPATGRAVTIGVITAYRYQGGKIVEHWGQFDSAGLMQQLAPPS